MDKTFIKSMVDAVKRKVYEAVYPQLKAKIFLDVSNDADPADRTITYLMYENTGMAKIISDYADDMPVGGVKGTEGTAKIRTVGEAYLYTRKELQAAQKTGNGLIAKKANSVRRGIEQKVDNIAWLGDAAHGILGLFYHPNITKAAAATGNWTNIATTAELIIADVKTAVSNMSLLTKGVERPTHILMDSVRYGEAATKFISGTSVSALEKLQSIYPNITFDILDALQGITNPVTGTGTTNGLLLLTKDPDVVTLEIPEEFIQLDSQITNLVTKVPCLEQTAGCLVYRPLAISIIAGL